MILHRTGNTAGGLPTVQIQPVRAMSYQRFRLPRMPRTSARPSEEATVRATVFMAASAIVSRW